MDMELPCRVLLVDDDMAIREALDQFLRSQYGFDVTTAVTPQEAMQRVDQATMPFDVALIDDMLVHNGETDPSLVGVELMQTIRRDSPKTECIIITGWGMEPRGIEALRRGAYRYLGKPLNLEELAMTIKMAKAKQHLKSQFQITTSEKKQLQTLLRIGRAIISIRDLPQLLEQIHFHVSQLMDVSGMDIVLFDESTNMLRWALCFDRGVRFAGWKRPFGDPVGLTEMVITSKQPVLLGNFPEDSPRASVYLKHYGDEADQETIKSWLGVPLIVRDKVIGIICVQSYAPHFYDETDQHILSAIANQVAPAIENAQLREQERMAAELAQRRERLLTALDVASRHIRAVKSEKTLLQSIVRLAAELIDFKAGALLTNRAPLAQAEVSAVYELPDVLLTGQVAHGQGLIGKVAAKGFHRVIYGYDKSAERDEIFAEYGIKTAVAIPLEQPSGEIEAVLFLADPNDKKDITETDLEILQRFALKAALALQTSKLINREQRRVNQLTILHKISDYIQEDQDLDKVLHVVLTGVTAGYGLCFNRAALFLINKQRTQLNGRVGIGYHSVEEAKRDWDDHQQRGLENFTAYLSLLEQSKLPHTPVGDKIQQLQIPLQPDGADLFSAVVNGGHYALINEVEQLPETLVVAFDPTPPLIVAPLLVRDQVIGLLVADNKFTRSPITKEDIELLLTFVNTAALAIENTRLLQQTRLANAKLRSFYEGSNKLISLREPEKLLQEIVENAYQATEAMSVGVALIDNGIAHRLYTTGINPPTFEIRPNGLSNQVMKTGQPVVIEDTLEHHHINPNMANRGVRSALCFPLSLKGECVGVMWLYYNTPQEFSQSNVDALRLFVNQAALAFDTARRIKQLQHMQQAVDAIANVANLPEVLLQIVQSACDVLEADTACIYPYDDIRKQFIQEHIVAAGIPDQIFERFKKVGPSPDGTAHTVMEKKWIKVTDLHDQNQFGFVGKRTRSLLKQINACSFQGIALKADMENLGVLYVNYDQKRNFSDEEHQIAQTFANHAALALRKAKLHEQVRKARNAAYAVANVSILGNLEDTLVSIANETIEVADCDAVTVYAYDEEHNKLSREPITTGLLAPKGVTRFPDVEKDSIVYTMLAQSELYLVEDVSQDELFCHRSFVKREQISSCAALPLHAAGMKVGVMFVNYRHPHRFTAHVRKDIELLAYQAANAIRSAQLFAKEQKRVRIQQALSEASQAVASSLELNDLLSQIAKQAWALMHIGELNACYSLVTLNQNQEMLFPAGYPTSFLAILQQKLSTQKLDEAKSFVGIVGRAIATGKTQRVGNVTTDPDYIEVDKETRSQIAVPICMNRSVIGVISVEHPEPNAFDDDEVDALESLALSAAVAIEHARLYKVTKKRARLLDTAARVARDATAATDIRELLNKAARLIGRQFNFYHTGVFLLSKNKTEAILQATYPQKGSNLIQISHRLKVGKEGIVGHVVQTGKFHLALDVTKDPYYVPNLGHTRSEIGLPLIAHDKIIGVLDVQSDHPLLPNDEVITTLQTLADQLANAIHNAQLNQQLVEQRDNAQALQRVAVALSGESELDEILQVVMNGAMHFNKIDGGNILLWDATKERFIKTLKTDENGKLKPYLSQARTTPAGRARSIIDKRGPYFIEDATKIKDFNPNFIQEGFRASLGVPIIGQKDVIGVLYVRSRQPQRFSEHQIALMEALASQAAVAIERSRQFEELKKIKGLIGAHTATEWISMVSQAWGHHIRREVGTARLRVALMRNLVERGSKPARELDKLELALEGIKNVPITAPLTYEDVAERVLINTLLVNYLNLQWQHDRFKLVRLKLNLQPELDEKTAVWAGRAWLQRGLELIIDNAAWYMRHEPHQEITVTTCFDENKIKIMIQDTGPGIPPEIQSRLFIKPIPKKEGSRGSGIGLMLAQTIFQTYHGDIYISSSNNNGTCVAITLPTIDSFQ